MSVNTNGRHGMEAEELGASASGGPAEIPGSLLDLLSPTDPTSSKMRKQRPSNDCGLKKNASTLQIASELMHHVLEYCVDKTLISARVVSQSMKAKAEVLLEQRALLQLPLLLKRIGVEDVKEKVHVRIVNRWALSSREQVIRYTMRQGQTFDYFFGDNVWSELAQGLRQSSTGKHRMAGAGAAAQIGFESNISSRLTEQLLKVDQCLSLCHTNDQNKRTAIRTAIFGLLAGGSSPPMFAESKVTYDSEPNELSQCYCFMAQIADGQKLQLFGSRRTPLID